MFLLVNDCSKEQNVFEQVKVTFFVITKLDGTVKVGVVIGISYQFKVSAKYIGVVEEIYDLQVFNKHEFVASFIK